MSFIFNVLHNSLARRRFKVNFRWKIVNLILVAMAEVSLVKLPSYECHFAIHMVIQHGFRQWLGAVRQQAITWVNVDIGPCIIHWWTPDSLTIIITAPPQLSIWYCVSSLRHLLHSPTDYTMKHWSASVNIVSDNDNLALDWRGSLRTILYHANRWWLPWRKCSLTYIIK